DRPAPQPDRRRRPEAVGRGRRTHAERVGTAMSAEDCRDPDDRLAAWLTAYADSPADGGSDVPDKSDLPPELWARADRAVAGLRLLKQLRPASGPASDPPGSRALPWSTLG